VVRSAGASGFFHRTQHAISIAGLRFGGEEDARAMRRQHLAKDLPDNRRGANVWSPPSKQVILGPARAAAVAPSGPVAYS
jgi:hypothetical protein